MNNSTTSYAVPAYTLQLVRDKSIDMAERERITQPNIAAGIFYTLIGNADREHLVAILLDTKNRPIGVHTVAIGGLNAAAVRVADIFKAAIVANAAAIIISHNHPSGDTSPSPDDVRITEMIVSAGKLLDVGVLDHIIVGDSPYHYCSLKERRLGF